MRKSESTTESHIETGDSCGKRDLELGKKGTRRNSKHRVAVAGFAGDSHKVKNAGTSTSTTITGQDQYGDFSVAAVIQGSENSKTASLSFNLPRGTSDIGDPRILKLMVQSVRVHAAKQTDYGSEGDPFANIRASEDWGIPAWVGALVRLNDKVHRLKEFAKKGSLANESAKDSMLDIAVYALISYVLYEELDEGKVRDVSQTNQENEPTGGVPV